jgi:hypothetical protein
MDQSKWPIAKKKKNKNKTWEAAHLMNRGRSEIPYPKHRGK